MCSHCPNVCRVGGRTAAFIPNIDPLCLLAFASLPGDFSVFKRLSDNQTSIIFFTGFQFLISLTCFAIFIIEFLLLAFFFLLINSVRRWKLGLLI